MKGSGWKSAALKVGTASIFQRRAAFRTAGSAVSAAIWSAVRSISPHMGPTSERILSRTWLTFAATFVPTRPSILGVRMETAQPTEGARRAIQRALPAMACAITRPQRTVVRGLDISSPLSGAPLSEGADPELHPQCRLESGWPHRQGMGTGQAAGNSSSSAEMKSRPTSYGDRTTANDRECGEASRWS